MTSRVPAWVQQARDRWTNTGDERPLFAVEPGPGQESVWDYPRPPAVVTDKRHIEVRSNGRTIASTTGAVRVLETSHPPSFYIPPVDIVDGAVAAVAGSSHCEWKGAAEFVSESPGSSPIGWRYPRPYPEFLEWADWLSFYPDRVECRIDGELVRAPSRRLLWRVDQRRRCRSVQGRRRNIWLVVRKSSRLAPVRRSRDLIARLPGSARQRISLPR